MNRLDQLKGKEISINRLGELLQQLEYEDIREFSDLEAMVYEDDIYVEGFKNYDNNVFIRVAITEPYNPDCEDFLSTIVLITDIEEEMWW